MFAPSAPPIPPGPPAGVTVTETSTTWQQGFMKVIMHTAVVDGKTSRKVKVIDLRPKGRAMPGQWEGTLAEFLEYAHTLAKMADFPEMNP